MLVLLQALKLGQGNFLVMSSKVFIWIKWSILVGAGFAFVLFFATPSFLSSMDSFKIAKNFVLSSKDIQTEFGESVNVTPSRFGWAVSSSGSKKMAGYKLYVSSATKSGEIFIELEQEHGKWEVIKVTHSEKGVRQL